ncbi:MAG: HlyD family secretion protein [Moritella sp.]|uniref:HlyD family secretion protein n=1 Tax=Moritella sp. TaxID=78556 RepID=UPI0025CD0502|nr:HlyD family secretion protein [Moritella sp.]NQZ93603.1 HlyD family secretion protein [Moritella sp.]
MKTTLLKSIVAGLLLSGAAGFYYYLMPAPGIVATDNAYVHGEISQVSAEVSGVVAQVFVTDNQYVKAGQLLATLDDSNYLALKAQASSAFRVAQATVANVNARIEFQKININEVATRITAAQADADFQYLEWQRFSDLLKSKLISQSRYDAQKATKQQTSAVLAATFLQLKAAKQQLKTLQTEREQMIAMREQSKASLKLADLQLEDTKIVAPVSGIIGNRVLRKGRYVSQGSPLLAIVPMDDIWIEANYKEGQITNIKPGQKVSITLDSFPQYQLVGQVISAAPATGAQFSLLPPNNATGNFVKIVQRIPVKISITLPAELQGRVVPGLSAEVEINTNDKV